MSQEIIVDVSAAGTVKIEANGFTGTSCAKATEQIEIAIGGAAVKKKDPKPEYYQTPGVHQDLSNNF